MKFVIPPLPGKMDLLLKPDETDVDAFLASQPWIRDITSNQLFSAIQNKAAGDPQNHLLYEWTLIASKKADDENKEAALLAALRISRSCIWAGKKAVAEAAKAGKKAVAAAATTAADGKKPLDELHADIQVSRTSRHFLNEVFRLVQELGLEAFIRINAQEPWGFSKMLRGIAEGIQSGTFVLPPVLREGKATLPMGSSGEYVLEAIFHPGSREYISSPPLGGLMPPPSNKYMGVFPKFVNDCSGKGIVINTSLLASLFRFLKREYQGNSAHEAFTTAAGSEFLDQSVIGLLLSGNFPDTHEKVKHFFDAVFQQLKSRITLQDDYHDEKIGLITHIKKYYDARKNSFWTEEEGFNQSFLEPLASLMTMFEIFASCEDNYIGCWVSYFDRSIEKHLEKFVATNNKLRRQMDDLRSRIINLFADQSSWDTVVEFVPPQYPPYMKG